MNEQTPKEGIVNAPPEKPGSLNFRRFLARFKRASERSLAPVELSEGEQQTLVGLVGQARTSQEAVYQTHRESVRGMEKDTRVLSDDSRRSLEAVTGNKRLLIKAIQSVRHRLPVLMLIDNAFAVGGEFYPKEFKDFATSFVSENLAIIEGAFQPDSAPQDVFMATKSLSGLIRYGNYFQKGRALRSLLNNYDVIVGSWNRLPKNEQLSLGGVLGFEYILNQVVTSANYLQLHRLQGMILKGLNNQNPQVAEGYYNQILMLFGVGEDADQRKMRAQARFLAAQVLQNHGLNYKNLAQGWIKGNPFKTKEEMIDLNLRDVVRLESKRPGICKFLYNNFNISHFGRYPVDLLTSQYDEANNSDLPYGVILASKFDHDGGVYESRNALNELHQQLQGRYAIRVFECGSNYDVARALIKTRQLYNSDGKGHKISFAIIAGHGKPQYILWGRREKDRDTTWISDFSRPAGQRLAEFFEQNPSVILISCSSYEKNSIAGAIIGLGARVIAPEGSIAGTDHIYTNMDQGRLNFKVAYNYGGSKTFVFGGGSIRGKVQTYLNPETEEDS